MARIGNFACRSFDSASIQRKVCLEILDPAIFRRGTGDSAAGFHCCLSVNYSGRRSVIVGKVNGTGDEL